MERCPSGLRCRPGTSVWGRLHRGFESLPFRFSVDGFFMDNIPVFMSSDNNFAPFVATTMASILKNTEAFIDFYVLDCGISNKNKKKIQNTYKYFKNFNIEFLHIDANRDFADFPEMKYISKAMYSRFLIPKLKPELNKAIYTDIDVAFTGDILRLYEINLENHIIGAVPIYRQNEIAEFLHQIKERLELENIYDILMSGLLLIDCEKWNEANVTDELLSLTTKLAKENKLIFPDMDVLNKYFGTNYKHLDKCFCIIPKTLNSNFTSEEIDNLIANQVICHFAGGGKWKPWNNKHLEGAQYFWKCVKYTDFQNEIQNIHRNFVIKSFFYNIFNFFKPYFRRGKNFIKNQIILKIKNYNS